MTIDRIRDQINDRRRGCQERKEAHSIGVDRDNLWGKAIGITALLFALLAIAIESRAGISLGAVAALVAAALAVVDVFLELPKAVSDHADAADHFADAERRIANLLAVVDSVPEAERLQLLHQATDIAKAAEEGRRVVSRRLLDAARRRINKPKT